MSQGLVYSMEGQDDSGLRTPPGERSLGIGLGVGILLIAVFSMTCLVYWLSCRGSRTLEVTRTRADIEQGLPMPPEPISRGLRPLHGESFSVLMPGDRVPMFVALPCPREASTEGSGYKVVDCLEKVTTHQKLHPPT